MRPEKAHGLMGRVQVVGAFEAMAGRAVRNVFEILVRLLERLMQRSGLIVIGIVLAVERQDRHLNPIDEVDRRKRSVNLRLLLRRTTEQRAIKRETDRRHKRGSVRFVLLVLTLILTAAIVTVVMFRTLYLLLS